MGWWCVGLFLHRLFDGFQLQRDGGVGSQARHANTWTPHLQFRYRTTLNYFLFLNRMWVITVRYSLHLQAGLERVTVTWRCNDAICASRDVLLCARAGPPVLPHGNQLGNLQGQP